LQAFGKPTIDNIGVNGVNKKRVGKKEKGIQQKKGLAQPLMLILIFLLQCCSLSQRWSPSKAI
jgi:hypothetical protein